MSGSGAKRAFLQRHNLLMLTNLDRLTLATISCTPRRTVNIMAKSNRFGLELAERDICGSKAASQIKEQ